MANVTTPFEDPSAARSPGGHMTLPRKMPFLHLGGPADGSETPVQVDANGEPPEFYTLMAMTSMDYGINPGAGIAGGLIYSLYEREEKFGDQGFYYVFNYRGADVQNPPPMAA